MIMHIINKLVFFFTSLFGGTSKHSASFGELTVVAIGKTGIKLKSRPRKVKVKFVDSCVSVPCNPKSHDKLEWVITKYNGQHYLMVGWSVSNTRTIAWEVCY